MIDIRRTTVYRGPNIWARVPAIHLTVDIGELEDRPSNTIEGFNDRLITLMPSLEEHSCSLGHRGGFIERLRRGTWMGHVLEHVALEIQGLAGASVTRGLTREADQRGVYNVIYEYRQGDVGLEAGKLAVRLLNHLIYNAEPEFDFVHELEENVILLPSGSPTGRPPSRSSTRPSDEASPSFVSTRPDPWCSSVTAATNAGSGRR